MESMKERRAGLGQGQDCAGPLGHIHGPGLYPEMVAWNLKEAVVMGRSEWIWEVFEYRISTSW